jgi:uncharacterized lipoprotein YajG
MTRTITFALAAAAALAGCNKEDHTITSGPEAGNATANADVVLPPSISASKIYRCKDNSVVYIDWLSDNKSANVRGEKNGAATHVMAAEEGKPMVAEGYSLTGTATASSVTLARPGKGSQSCKA